MLLILYILLIAINALIALRCKSSKVVVIATMVFVVVVFVGSRDVADLDNYIDYFKHGFESFGKGGQYLFHIVTIYSHQLGMTFDMYRLTLSVCGLLFYYIFIIKYSPLPNFVMVSYLAYLIFMDDVQIRNFIGCALFLMALSVLIQHKKHWRIKYLFTLLFACMIHTSFWVYLLFVFLPSDDLFNDKKYKIVGLIALSVSIMFLFIRDNLNDLIMLFSFLDEDKTERYSDIGTHFGGVVFIIIQLISILGVLYIRNKIENTNYHLCNKNISKDIQFLHITYLINILALLFIPSVIFSMTFYRLIRNLFFINVVSFSIGYKYMKRKFVPLVLAIVFTAIYMLYDFNEINIRDVLQPIFNKNIYMS